MHTCLPGAPAADLTDDDDDLKEHATSRVAGTVVRIDALQVCGGTCQAAKGCLWG